MKFLDEPNNSPSLLDRLTGEGGLGDLAASFAAAQQFAHGRPQVANNILMQRQEGRRRDRFQQMREEQARSQQEAAMRRSQALAQLSPEARMHYDLTGKLPQAPAPMSSAGKLAADLQSGMITQEQYDNASRKNALVNVNTGEQQTQFSKEMGKTFASAFRDGQQAGAAASASNARLAQLEQLAGQVATGPLAPITTSFKAVAKNMGVDLSRLGLDDNVGQAEALKALTADFVLAQAERMKGVLSDRDIQFLVDSVATLTNTPQGIQEIIALTRRMNEMAIQIAAGQREYVRTNPQNQLDAGWYEVEAGLREQFAQPLAPPTPSHPQGAQGLPAGAQSSFGDRRIIEWDEIE